MCWQVCQGGYALSLIYIWFNEKGIAEELHRWEGPSGRGSALDFLCLFFLCSLLSKHYKTCFFIASTFKLKGWCWLGVWLVGWICFGRSYEICQCVYAGLWAQLWNLLATLWEGTLDRYIIPIYIWVRCLPFTNYWVQFPFMLW